jgi:hypothetical protein
MTPVNEREQKDPLVEIADLAEELCDATQHVERIYGWTPSRHRKLINEHVTIKSGLIDQLREAIFGTTATEDEGRRSIPSSKPPLLLEALARLLDITIGSNEWIHRTREVNRGDLESNVRALVGAAGRLDSSVRIELLVDMRRWRSWAAVMSGWALPPYQPHVACPMSTCGKLSSIRIILERKTGLCVECQTVWDDRDGSINLLAAYIAEETAKPHERVPVGSTVAGHGGWSERRRA